LALCASGVSLNPLFQDGVSRVSAPINIGLKSNIELLQSLLLKMFALVILSSFFLIGNWEFFSSKSILFDGFKGELILEEN
jgi:hypothetical protein